MHYYFCTIRTEGIFDWKNTLLVFLPDNNKRREKNKQAKPKTEIITSLSGIIRQVLFVKMKEKGFENRTTLQE